jgi:NADPH:quinone reductase-like Zn-dependent oxidoreductase
MYQTARWPEVAACMAALSFAGAALAQAPGPGAAPRMKAIVYRQYGSPDVLRLEEVERPVPADDRVLVRVRAASVNPLDWHFMRGTPYLVRLDLGLLRPTFQRLGVDMAGVVEAVGRNVTRFKPGDEVFGQRSGAFAEYVSARERSLVLKPSNLTFEEAASVPVAAVTALQGLRDKGKLQPGQKVLINGASGGVGTFAVQIAKSIGAQVTGVCSTRNLELVRSLGADRVIDYTREDFTQGSERYDVILDMVGSHSLSDTRHALTPKGTLVVVGSTDIGRWLGPLVGLLRAVVLSRFGSQGIAPMLAQINPEDLTIVANLMQAGKVRAVIDRRYQLGETAEAVRYVEGGHARGKVVVSMEPGDQGSPAGAPPAASAAGATGSDLVAWVLLAIAVVAPIAAALALNSRFQRRNPGKRPYRWGYYLSIESLLAGIALGIALESGAATAIACALVYALLAWSFARRRRWAWLALTILTFNPIAWIVNAVYLRKRWAEDSAAAPAA